MLSSVYKAAVYVHVHVHVRVSRLEIPRVSITVGLYGTPPYVQVTQDEENHAEQQSDGVGRGRVLPMAPPQFASIDDAAVVLRRGVTLCGGPTRSGTRPWRRGRNAVRMRCEADVRRAV